MKLNFQYSEEEKKAILEQHNFYKKVLQSKVKRLMVNEQVEGEEVTTTTPTGREFLISARDKGCQIAVGGVIKSAPGKPTVLYKKADYDSTVGLFKKGDELYIKDDYTFDIVKTDASGTKTMITGKKWKCDALTAEADAAKKASETAAKTKQDAEVAAKTKQDTDAATASQANIDKTKLEGNWNTKKELVASGDTEQNIENPQMYEKKVIGGITHYRRKVSGSIGAGLTADQNSIIDSWKNKGYKLRKELSPEEAKTFKSEIVSPASEGYFSQDLIMYFDPTTLQTLTITDVIQDAVKNRIPKDKKDCKQTIEAYHVSFKKKRPLTPNEFNALKTKTQACKNEFYKDWGTFGGGSKSDEILDMMLGLKSGGPSSYGDDSKWRLQ
jgi:hypothetical protein